MSKIKLSITLLQMMTSKFFKILILSLFTISCGFKVVNRADLGSFNIAEINTSGEKS